MQESELRKMILTQTILPQAPDEIVDRIEDFREYMVLYNSAIREVTTKLEILNDELSLRQSKNPIQFIKSRVKKPTSIINKLQRLEQDINVESVTSLNDVAGIRVIASGGRVIAVTGLANGLALARDHAYESVSKIDYLGKTFRTDIGLDVI